MNVNKFRRFIFHTALLQNHSFTSCWYGHKQFYS